MPIRLFLHLLSIETRKLTTYRADFWINALGGFLVQLAVTYFLWRTVYTETGKTVIAGYSFPAMVTYCVLVVLLGHLIRGDVRQIAISQEIYDGSLTRYLLFPAPYLAFKYAEHLGSLLPATVQLVCFGAVSYYCLELGELTGITLSTLAMTLVALAVGNVLAFLMVWPLQAVSFWADNVWSLNVMLRFIGNMLGGFLLPLSVFPESARKTLVYLPFRYLYDFPVNTLLGRISAAEWWSGLGIASLWCLAITGFGRWVWKRGCLTYTGVGI